MPAISIIVPVYKVEAFIHRCVDSILDQTFTDFELILVDDGSPDHCGCICDKYAEKDRRVRVIHQGNSGLSMARNAGIKESTGEYLLFCDSDDYVSDRWCESLMRCISSGERRYIFGGINVEYHQGNNSYIKKRVPSNMPCIMPVKSFLSLQLQNQVGYAWNVLYDASVVRKQGLLFSKDYIIEDLPFNLKYLSFCDCLCFSGEANYYYVQDERDTLSRKYQSDSFRRWREKYSLSSSFIEKYMKDEEFKMAKVELADSYIYLFLQSLEDTFDQRNKDSFIEKIKYNQRTVVSKEFQDCLKWTKCNNEDKRILWLLKRKLYILVWLLNKVAKMRSLDCLKERII